MLVHEYDNLFEFLILCPLSYIASLQAEPRNPVIIHVFLTVRDPACSLSIHNASMLFILFCASKSPKH